MIALRWHVLRLPLLLSLLWCLLLFALFQWTVQREDENATELAQIQTRTLFSSIVNTRGWNADRGGVWATEQPNCQPNPWLPEDQRTLLTADGRRLVRFNPAYMTRQIAERFQSKTMNFHICGLSPKRPQNRPDQWETSALLDFDAGKTEREAAVLSVNMLEEAGYKPFEAGRRYQAGEKVYYNNRGKCVLAATVGRAPLEAGIHMNMAHIDSPRLDLKQNPLYESDELAFLKTHY